MAANSPLFTHVHQGLMVTGVGCLYAGAETSLIQHAGAFDKDNPDILAQCMPRPTNDAISAGIAPGRYTCVWVLTLCVAG